MSNKSPKEEGFEAGTRGESRSSNPHDGGLLGRAVDIMIDVGSAGAARQVEQTDRNTADWKSGHDAGTAARNNNK